MQLPIHISASSIAAFRTCPQRFRLAYVEGLRPVEDTETLRMGTNWHALHETWANAEGDKLEAVVTHLNERYASMPNGFDKAKWELERQILLTSFLAYQWYYQNDPLTFLASEIPFQLPLYMLRSGMPISKSKVARVGKIDHIVLWNGAICALERKSTSRSIDPDSDYWQRWQKDAQIGMYALALKDLRASGGLAHLNPLPLEEGIPMPRFGNILVDVWHKPTIKPCMLTQNETGEFLDTHEYYGQKFEVEYIAPDSKTAVEGAVAPTVTVNGVLTEVEPGKRAIAIRETVDMFAARLLADIQERPGHYFARREIVRTDKELAEFKRELFAIYQAQAAFIENDTWFSNESACDSPFRCAYKSVCYGEGADEVCKNNLTPAGFKRMVRVDLTVNGEIQSE